MVVVPKKKESKLFFGKSGKPAPATKPATTAKKSAAEPAQAGASPAATRHIRAQPEPAHTPAQPAAAATPSQAEPPATPPTTTAATATPATAEPSEAEQLKAAIAAAPRLKSRPIRRASPPLHRRRTPTKFSKTLLDKIFAQGFDDRLMASLPGFWKLYYQAVAAKTDYRPSDPAVMRQNTVDKKAQLLAFNRSVIQRVRAGQRRGRNGSLSHRGRRRRQSGRDRGGPANRLRAGRERRGLRFAKPLSRRRSMTASRFPFCWIWWSSSTFIRREPRRPPSWERKIKPEEPKLPGPYSLQAER